LILALKERQLVAGIRAHYTPEDLIGKQIVVVRESPAGGASWCRISQGMLLACVG
jgi:tRNA-binding EMAP/Myf-like protein